MSLNPFGPDPPSTRETSSSQSESRRPDSSSSSPSSSSSKRPAPSDFTTQPSTRRDPPLENQLDPITAEEKARLVQLICQQDMCDKDELAEIEKKREILQQRISSTQRVLEGLFASPSRPPESVYHRLNLPVPNTLPTQSSSPSTSNSTSSRPFASTPSFESPLIPVPASTPGTLVPGKKEEKEEIMGWS